MKIIILAGGSGTRLWPLSRMRYPKQFIKLQHQSKSLFQESFERSLLLADINDIYVVTNEKYKFLVMKEVDELTCGYDYDNILVEPEPKNTLPACYAGVYEIIKKGIDTVVVFPSDHMISKSKEFIELIKASEELAKDSIITFGIKPDGPNTGYGYISPGEPLFNGYRVNSFKEKPNKQTAIEYINKGYYWNAGIFMFNSDTFSKEVKKYSPEIYKAFQTSDNLNEAFSKISTKISIDYGIMEKSSKVALVPADIGWNDLGSFDSIYEVFEKKEHGNIADNDHIIIDSKNNLIHSEPDKLVSIVGVEDLIIVDNEDALLICRRNQSQKVKKVVDILKDRNDKRVDSHIKDYRPWGSFKELDKDDFFNIKRIIVNPGKSISYQVHPNENEHWVVTKGIAKVTIEEEVKYVHAGENIYISSGKRHHLENTNNTTLEVIAVQVGDPL